MLIKVVNNFPLHNFPKVLASEDVILIGLKFEGKLNGSIFYRNFHFKEPPEARFINGSQQFNGENTLVDMPSYQQFRLCFLR